MKKLLFIILALLPLTGAYAQKSTQQIINQYFEAFNKADLVSLNSLITNDFVMQEGSFVICNNRKSFATIFRWDSVFQPKFEVQKITPNESGAIVRIAKTGTRIQFLHDSPMVSDIHIKIIDHKLKTITINDYVKFDNEKWQGRLNDLKNWVSKHHPDLNGFERDLTKRGSQNYLKAIKLYSKRELALEEKIFIDKTLQLVHLKDSIFLHVSWYPYGGGKPYPSNGLLVVKNGKAIMIDTPPDNKKTKKLYEFLLSKMNIEVTYLIPGHFHIDCMGGIDFLHKQGVHSLCGSMTYEKCKTEGLTLPNEYFKKEKVLNFNGLTAECKYFGGGHSFDNITVWLPESKVLFGGCMIKDVKANGMGNLSDASVNEWDGTVMKIQDEYPQAEIVIPGHGDYGGKELLAHTIEVVQNYKASNVTK
ncbi:subclass B1 metallo-beta-lactamase [Labilibacter marinus]|uniref:subclass B1 metallo-beta-lactamase n=1 Tax=Labilibacter marinus TaxID=1477105 RepID=UPI0009FAA3E1|nr:subclass B1 metallo-beta-lactamase [Labilibacter marinus]